MRLATLHPDDLRHIVEYIRQNPDVGRKRLVAYVKNEYAPVARGDVSRFTLRNAQTLLADVRRRERSRREIDDIVSVLGGSRRSVPSPTREKTLIFSCLHAPFHRLDLLNRALDDHPDARRVILAGDILDIYSLSRHPKSENVSLKEEIDGGLEILDAVCSRVGEVLIMEGNHEHRVVKYIYDRLPPEVADLLVDTNIIRRLVALSGHRNIRLVGNPVEGSRSVDNVNFIYQHGDAVICHVAVNSRIAMRPAEKVFVKLWNWQRVLNLSDFRVLILAHTHKLGKVPRPPHYLLMEAGCLFHIPKYSVNHKMPYDMPQQAGYAILVQDGQGRTDVNASGFHWYRDAY